MITILQGDWIEQLSTLPDCSVHCCITSPPYWGLRDYGVPGQLGLEKTPEEYVAKIVEGFREVRRVLRDDGTCWVNLGDSYASGGQNSGSDPEDLTEKQRSNGGCRYERRKAPTGLKPKNLVGIPWRIAFALQADGWYLRSDIIWSKPNPMPESVTDRPTKAHEYIFLLTKSQHYYYDCEAIKEPSNGWNGSKFTDERDEAVKPNLGRGPRTETASRNKRTVWTVPSQAYPESHFATFPEDLIKPCILAGTSARGCCPKCGAPWERIVKITQHKIGDSPLGNFRADARRTKANGDIDRSDVPQVRTRKEVETTGWQPTCECIKEQHPGVSLTGSEWMQLADKVAAEFGPIPCTVLDPFGGSGTTGQVALELGRRAILIELNSEYVALIKRRTHVTPGLTLA